MQPDSPDHITSLRANYRRIDRYVPEAFEYLGRSEGVFDFSAMACAASDKAVRMSDTEAIYWAGVFDSDERLGNLVARWCRSNYMAGYAHALADLNEERIVV